ncbi:MAG TPA: large extracellular alpha-helical protein [Nitrospirae bacterium]|nr:large extracellular alpha-helical protein [Nitrospirota bacterium]
MWNLFALILIIATFSLPALAAFDSAKHNSAKGPLEVLRIKPNGVNVQVGRQVVFTFNRPVVPLGRMERDSSEIPVSIEPELKCEWRWLDTSNLACQLTQENALNPSTEYSIIMKPGIRAEDGDTIEDELHHTFTTLRPNVSYTSFWNWAAPGSPVIFVRFNQAVTEQSIAEHVFFLYKGKIRVPSKVEQNDNTKHYSHGTAWIISPEEELPGNTPVQIVMGPGVLSQFGPVPSKGRVIESFHTFPEFRLKSVRCYDNASHEIVSSTAQKNLTRRCNPLGSAILQFSAPPDVDTIKKHLSVIPDLAGGRTDYDPWERARNRSRISTKNTSKSNYSLRLPEKLKAYEKYQISASKERIKDLFGRNLSEDINIEFLTDHRKPKYSFEGRYFVLEKGIDSEVPIVVTNLDAINLSYRSENHSGAGRGSVKLDIPEIKDVSFAMPIGLRKLIDDKSGTVSASFVTSPSVSNERWFYGIVSPYNLHVKVGHFNTIVWAVDYATGEPVPNAKVQIYVDIPKNPGAFSALLAEGVTDENGLAVLPGLEKLDPKLTLFHGNWWDNDKPKVFVRCIKGDDMAVLPLVNEFNIHAQGANRTYISSSQKKGFHHIKAWGTTAQGVYKAGDTIQYKIYVRNESNERLVLPPKGNYTLKVVDPMGKTVHIEKDIELSDFGAFDGEVAVAENGAVGWYWFNLTSSYSDWTLSPMRVLVSDFTPAPFRVSVDLNGEMFRQDDAVEASSAARLHAGGPYADAEARVIARLKSVHFSPKSPKAKGFNFNTFSRDRRRPSTYTVWQQNTKVDDKGDLLSEFTVYDTKDVQYGKLIVETSIRDDRGKYISSETSARYIGRDRFVGIRQGDWILKEGEKAQVEAIVVDEYGKVAAGTDIEFKIEFREVTASRVKEAGNAYVTRYNRRWVSASSCELASTEDPVICEFTPEKAGSYRITANIKDTVGKENSSSLNRWATGAGYVLWESDTGNTLNIFPEKDDLRVGDTARYMVQNPFPGSLALITVERYGILKQWTKRLDNSTEVIEFPVLPDYLPGYYFSVVVVSPRVDKPVVDGNVDLGKPSMKMGYAMVPVKDPYKTIDVEVKIDREAYKPREKVSVALQAIPRNLTENEAAPETELAVVVIDESVFDLISGGKTYFDPYKGFYGLEPLDVMNYDLLLQLMGRRKFEKKGANQGGGGGMDLKLRSLFKFVSYWNPSIKTDVYGRAKIEFEVPDNLTGWKVLALAVTNGDRMGLGEGTFVVNRPTEIRPALPNQVTEGDEFKAGFTVMNRTDDPRTLKVNISAEGSIAGQKGGEPLSSSIEVDAEPYKRKKVWLPVTTSGDGEVRFTVTAQDEIDGDALAHVMPVRKMASLDVAATYGTTTADSVSENVFYPSEIRTDVGKVSVVASPSVIANLDGAFKYMKEYPYICWEQVLTKGVMAALYVGLKNYLPESIAWDDAPETTEKTLKLAANYQAPNGGMTYYVPQDSYVSPYLSAYTALAFTWLKELGHEIPEDVEARLHSYLNGYLAKDSDHEYYSQGMRSTVRAVALDALARSDKVHESDLRRLWPHAKEMSLFGKAHYLDALVASGNLVQMADEMADDIISYSSQSGGKFVFSETVDSGYDRILASPLRSNCAALSSLLLYSETSYGAGKAADIPFKLVRSIIQSRGNRTHWANTQENMFCMNALFTYSSIYEKERPEMTVSADLNGEGMGSVSFNDIRDEAVELERPIQPGDQGKKATITLNREGKGRLYYAARLFYALKELSGDPVNAGIEVRREYHVERDGKWVLMDREINIKQGELVRVDLYVSLPTARNFVVVDDHVPGGLEPVNRDLATSSKVDDEKGEFTRSKGSYWFGKDWFTYGSSRWSFYHKELRHHSARFYSEYLPPGNYHLSYVAQAIAPGKYTVLPVRAEEMYDPDVYGKGVPAVLKVME